MDSVNVSEKVTRKNIHGSLPERFFLDHLKSQKREEIFSPLTSCESAHPGGGSRFEGRKAMRVRRQGWGEGLEMGNLMEK